MSKIQLQQAGLAEEILNNASNEPGKMQIVTFNIGEKYGVHISQVQEIIRVGNITTVPNSPPYMDGVINLRGRVLPVLNMRKRLNLPVTDITKQSRIVVTEVNDKILGLLVDSVSHVIRVQSEHIEEAPEEVMEVDTNYITGVSKIDDQLIILLDLEKLLKKEKIEIKEGGNNGEEN